MHIAICDDDAGELAVLSQLLDAYRLETKACFTYKTYSDGVSLLEDMRRYCYDLLLLDVLMPLVNGMQLAHEIRTFDETAKIVFLTSSPEFAVESYAVNAFTYILKPAVRDNLYPVLDKLFRDSAKLKEGLAVRFQNGMANLLFANITHVEVMNKTLRFHMTDGSVRELTAPLSDYEAALLARPEYIRVHRAFIVNLWQVQEVRSSDLLTYTGSVIPISRRLYAEVRKAYADQLFEERGVK